MMYSTFETTTTAYSWNTGLKVVLEKETMLSDYTELEEDFDEKILSETLEWVCSRNKNLSMETPSLMMVTTGVHKSCRIWIDQSLLKPRPEIKDPKQGVVYYSTKEN